jgi:hypothetical protein
VAISETGLELARLRAQYELDMESFDMVVAAEKARLREEAQRKPLLHRLFPFTIKIVRR